MQKKRFIIVALALVFVLLLIPASAYAASNSLAADTDATSTVIKSKIGINPLITPTNSPIKISADAYEEPTYTATTTGLQRAEEIKRILAKYSPISIYMIECRADGKSVNDFISRWCFGINGVFGDLEMAVHEEYHGFQFIQAGSQQIVDDSVVIIYFSRDNIIQTAKATSKLPVAMRTKRWNAYVSTESDVTANIQGAYGLLDELSAYYYGCRAVIDSTEYLYNYIDKNGYSYELVSGYFSSVENSIQAFYEFNYWTLEYLLYLKANHPDQYKSVMGNENYRKAFSYFHDNFIAIEKDDAPKNKKAILDKLNNMNIRATEEDSIIWLGNTGIGKPTAEIEILKKELNKDKYIIMLNELMSPFSVYVPSLAPASSSLPVLPSWTPPVSTQTVNPTPSAIYINGEEKFFEAYFIDGSNYFKLRDLALVLSDTNKQFNLWYDETTMAIKMMSGSPYIQYGGEMTRGDGKAKTASPTASKIFLDGKELNFTVYNIEGNNFFKLRDLMSAFDIGVTYTPATNDIAIDTYSCYLVAGNAGAEADTETGKGFISLSVSISS